MTRAEFDLIRTYNLRVLGHARQFALGARWRALGDGTGPEDTHLASYANGAQDAVVALTLASAQTIAELQAPE